jgi:uncharacterized heparinase superfamily protein
MGYRGWPRSFESGSTQGFDWARATHDAYRRLGVPLVGRYVACRGEGPWFIVDWAEGTGLHRLTNRLHLHPEVQIEQKTDHHISLSIRGLRLKLRTLTPGQLEIVEGVYCPEFGQSQPAPVVQWSSSVALPFACGWSLHRPDVAENADWKLSTDTSGNVTLASLCETLVVRTGERRRFAAATGSRAAR